MRFNKGTRVRHPSQDAWGLGEVLEDSTEESTRIFFVGVGEKTLSLAHVLPVVVTGNEASHPVLDNLRVSTAASGAPRYRSLPRSIEVFQEQYPQGFHGQRFLEQERDYKVKAHEQMTKLLSEDEMTTLLGKEQHEEICRRAVKLVQLTNLIFPNEKMALKDGLVDQNAQRMFSLALFGLLYGKASPEKRFTEFSGVLERIGAAKWTTATYFLFMRYPDTEMFVKPTITQNAAEVCGIEIDYDSKLNWKTYSRVMVFSEILRKDLAALAPRDMIDVQSFMWCIAPD